MRAIFAFLKLFTRSRLVNHWGVAELAENERIAGEIEAVESGFVVFRLDEPIQPAGGASKPTTLVAVQLAQIKSIALYTLKELPRKSAL